MSKGNDRMPLTAGLTAKTDIVVEDRLTADRMGNPGFDVLSTPALVQLFGAASIQAIAPHQDVPLTGSVGMRIEVGHIAATPIGMHVRCTAKVVNVDGRRVSFTLEAHDEQELIGKGTHERFLFDPAKFLAKAQ
jgi:fluoroacetyl-CoA thioesterase